MNKSDLELRLLAKLRAKGETAVGLGIDLGTTKSSLACAKFDPVEGKIRCECIRFEQADGTRRVAVPSAVAIKDGTTVFGVEALGVRGKKGMRVERELFYETKNNIGLRYTYARAPVGFRNPIDIATQVLRHLRQSADDALVKQARFPSVVAVPASFHGAQRQATVRAAVTAFEGQWHKNPIRLLDEPYAAFVDLKFRAPERAEALLREDSNVLVFDFGGGTCDVAIFRVDTVRGGTLGARLLGSSRYHRLGGGDIDRAIVHDVLIPELLRQNNLERWSVSWHDKRRTLEPQLLDLAERLKLALSCSMSTHSAAGLAVADELSISSVDLVVHYADATLLLRKPTLTVAALQELLLPFLESNPAPEDGDEFVQRNSVFAPILQALARARLQAKDVHGILLCGSSSLLLPLQAALAAAFPDAQRVLLGDAEELQGAVARGAALQALSLQVLGEPLIAPVCSAELSLRVVSGTAPLMRAGDAVPSASKASTLLRPPRDNARSPTEIAVEVVADGNRLVGRSLWSLPPPVTTKDRLALDWKLDENQCVELRLSRVDHPETEPFVQRFDAPITHRDPGQLVRCRMLEREEAIRNDEVARPDFGEAFENHARDCAALGEYEKALHFVSLSMQEKGQSDYLLNLRGIYREKIGDHNGAKESYDQATDSSSARFNLALLHYRSGNYAEALACVDAAIDMTPSRAYRSLRGDILDKSGKKDAARLEWQDAVAGTPEWARLEDFELSWMERAARFLENTVTVDRIREERKRFVVREAQVERQGELPEYVSDGKSARQQ